MSDYWEKPKKEGFESGFATGLILGFFVAMLLFLLLCDDARAIALAFTGMVK